ncbi:MAG: Fic family protein [Promethearchaeota archaeon]
MFSDFDDSDLIQKYGTKLTEIHHNHKNGLLSYPTKIRTQELIKFGCEFTYHSNKMEGNPLDRMDVTLLLHDRDPITPNRSVPLWTVLEIVNHQNVFEILLKSKSEDISLDLITKWHKSLFFQTKHDHAGHLRINNVRIHGSNHNPPNHSQVSPLLKDLLQWFQVQKTILHPVILSGLFHLKFEAIHPFSDGNGRVGRFLMNKILFDSEYPLVNIAFEDRNTYFTALEKSIIQKDEKIFLFWYLNYFFENQAFSLYYN